MMEVHTIPTSRPIRYTVCICNTPKERRNSKRMARDESYKYLSFKKMPVITTPRSMAARISRYLKPWVML